MMDDVAEISGFHCWLGVSNVWYGRRLGASPPVVLRAETLDELHGKIRAWSKDHPANERYTFEPTPDSY